MVGARLTCVERTFTFKAPLLTVNHFHEVQMTGWIQPVVELEPDLRLARPNSEATGEREREREREFYISIPLQGNDRAKTQCQVAVGMCSTLDNCGLI